MNIHAAPFLAALCSAPILASCGSQAGNFFPLEKGSRWIYRVYTTTMDVRRITMYAVENLGRTPLNGEFLNARRTGGGTTYYYREAGGAIWRAGETLPDKPTRMYPTPVVVLPRPATLSSAPWSDWENTALLQRQVSPKAKSIYSIRVRLQIHFVIEQDNDEVVVPGGRFEHCLRVHGTGVTEADVGYHAGPTTIQVDSIAWFAPGVGLVKSERRETTNTPLIPAGAYRMELEEFHRG